MAATLPSQASLEGKAKSVLPAALSPNQRRTALSAINRPDPLQGWRWLCSELPQGGPAHHYLESIDIPFNNISAAPNWHQGGGFIIMPGTHSISAVSCTFYEDNTATTLKWINAWKNKVKNLVTGIYGLPFEYKANWVLTLLDNQNNDILKLTLVDCWPTDTNNLSLTYASTDRLTIQQTFSVDDHKIEFLR